MIGVEAVADVLYEHVSLVGWACGCGHTYSWSEYGGDILRAQAVHQAEQVAHLLDPSRRSKNPR